MVAEKRIKTREQVRKGGNADNNRAQTPERRSATGYAPQYQRKSAVSRAQSFWSKPKAAEAEPKAETKKIQKNM